MQRFAQALLSVMIALSAAACGDCVAIGTPSVYLSARDAPAGPGLSLADATVSHTHNGAWWPAYLGASGIPNICCTSGRVSLRIEKPGYATWDSTVTVRTRGQCDTPVPVTVVATLRRAANVLSRGTLDAD